MQNISILSDELIARLRAGEVIQKPYNVVKELLENALDSGATDIRIRIDGGGKKLIEVSDNGCGMSHEDAKVCLLPHATSKIKEMNDLQSIRTLGFRGEALHSIATVSMVELRTKETGNDIGTLISNFGGQLTDKMTGCADGTSVSVKALFFNTPARKTTMKSDGAETALITRLVTRYMLLCPWISFSYYVNGNIHVIQRKEMSEEACVSSVLGSDAVKNLTRIDYRIEGIEVKGFAGSPLFTKKTSEHIIISINGRYIEEIQPYVKLIKDAYRNTIQSHDFPVLVLRIKIDPVKVDPNVHPQKSKIDILDETLFRRAIFESIFSSVKSVRSCEMGPVCSTDDPMLLKEAMASDMSAEISTAPLGRLDEFPQKEIVEAKPEAGSYSFPELVALAQYKKTFIVAATNGFLFLVDQHALHEKQLFEDLMSVNTIEVQEPASPYILSLSAADSDLLEASQNLFKEYGLHIERLDSDTWKCYSVPMVCGVPIQENDIIDLIKQSVGNLGDSPSLEEFKRKMIAEVACKAAIKANQMLSLPEMQKLLSRAMTMKDAYFCPHGRPSVKAFRESTVDRWFKRT